MNFIGSGLVFVFFLASQGAAQNAKTPYPNPSMAPVSQYLMAREAEISLSRGVQHRNRSPVMPKSYVLHRFWCPITESTTLMATIESPVNFEPYLLISRAQHSLHEVHGFLFARWRNL